MQRCTLHGVLRVACEMLRAACRCLILLQSSQLNNSLVPAEMRVKLGGGLAGRPLPPALQHAADNIRRAVTRVRLRCAGLGSSAAMMHASCCALHVACRMSHVACRSPWLASLFLEMGSACADSKRAHPGAALLAHATNAHPAPTKHDTPVRGIIAIIAIVAIVDGPPWLRNA